jgi:hypothetical protein
MQAHDPPDDFFLPSANPAKRVRQALSFVLLYMYYLVDSGAIVILNFREPYLCFLVVDA